MQTTLFPYDSVRQEQDKLISVVLETIDKKENLVVHAPTGLGKTAATLAPAIERAIKQNKVVIFMTSRLTQHMLALETVSKIRLKHDIKINVVDLIGKKHMCLQPGASQLMSKEFADYCKAMREDELCNFYNRLKSGEKLSPATDSALVQLGRTSPNSPEQVKMVCAQQEYQLCPYEITMLQAADARVIITDYSYIFNPKIRAGFLNRIGKRIEDCILIVDEGHNLPDRVKDLASERITTNTLKRALKELEKHKEDGHTHHIKQIAELLLNLSEGVDEERYITRGEFLEGLNRICDIEELVQDLDSLATMIREEQKSSSCGALAKFLTAWQEDREGFTRILTVRRPKDNQEHAHPIFGKQEETFLMCSYRCLDPSVIAQPVFQDAYSSIIMSGTLTPVDMYAELVGIPEAKKVTLTSPFPSKNRLNVIIPKTTTKYQSRSTEMYKQIAEVTADVTEAIKGNVAVFFPSYLVMSEIRAFYQTMVDKTVFSEHQELTKEEREELIGKFKEYRGNGAVLLGVMGGSFSEGIDLPGHELRGVIVIGLPLGRPDLETKALIDYYQEKFGKGWEYGYTYPAFNKTLQSAGRCIRTETDRGVIVFIDERYAWQNYYSCFPKDWDVRISLLYKNMLRDFFNDG